jgi:hypothetical protein
VIDVVGTNVLLGGSRSLEYFSISSPIVMDLCSLGILFIRISRRALRLEDINDD